MVGFNAAKAAIGQVLRAVFCVVLVVFGNLSPAQAQDNSYIQIQALPTLQEAQTRARAYASAFDRIVGYQLGSRWYGVAIGPFTRDEASVRLLELRRENLIPPDSFLTDGSNFREQFYPAAGEAPVTPVAPLATVEATPLAPDAAVVTAPDPLIETPVEPAPVVVAEPEPVVIIEETPNEARRSEAALSADEKKDLQRALQWFGHYASAIDGSFGSGTRRSMASWQTEQGFEPTGILTTTQRAALTGAWQQEIESFGFSPVVDAEAGIEISLPLGLVAFDHYEPPFAHYNAKTETGPRVILISQPGDKAALYGLYDILQTLSVVPLEGDRNRGERSFEINATGAKVESYTYAELTQGLIKGYMLVWPPESADLAGRILPEMKASFKSIGTSALDPGMVAMSDASRQGLLSGLEIRRPILSRSGFYVDQSGTVVTTTQAVAQCGRITLDGVTDAKVVAADEALGAAVLRPVVALSAPEVASFPQSPDRIGSEIAVAGYSYQDTLPSAVLTYGTLDADTGLNGETGVKRLGVTTLDGDAGGPVVDVTGDVIGMLLPRETNGSRVMPSGVEFALSAEALQPLLQQAGVRMATRASGALAPEDLTRRATGLTVLVSCWN